MFKIFNFKGAYKAKYLGIFNILIVFTKKPGSNKNQQVNLCLCVLCYVTKVCKVFITFSLLRVQFQNPVF